MKKDDGKLIEEFIDALTKRHIVIQCLIMSKHDPNDDDEDASLYIAGNVPSEKFYEFLNLFNLDRIEDE